MNEKANRSSSVKNFSRILSIFTFSIVSITLMVPTVPAWAHDGPDPVAHWNFNSRSLVDGKLKARLGPDAKVSGSVKPVGDSEGESLSLSEDSQLLIGKSYLDHKKYLPQQSLTVSTWVAVNQSRDWGGIVGVVQDNGDEEQGWIVGYNKRRFYFALASKGADDGNGNMTYLESKTPYELGKLYHVVAVYDGTLMQIFVNGELAGESKSQSGDILYPKSAPFYLGKYIDSNENHPHIGRIREISIYDRAAKPAWAKHEFEHQSKLASLPPVGAKPVEFKFAVEPYLQFATQTEMTVMCQTTRAATSTVYFGEDAKVTSKVSGAKGRFIHEVKLSKLKPETQYFYRVETVDLEGKSISSNVYTFQTASKKETPFAFAIISDTQSNPAVSGKVAELAWAQRPNFLLHPGDLVGTGTNDDHWTKQFFPSMHPLISRVPFYPVLGNHEVNARNYYDYVSLPDPEYYYEFQYGNAHFFMIDSNKKVDPDTEQYKWLDSALSKSTATWKFVCHHHPPYSSDENDYGNLWKSNKSTRGDLRVRQLSKLYDKYNVDIVWNGHIHSYERTWPLRAEKVAKKKGTVYMVTGGGGGGLETAGPFRPFFQNNVKRGHHYCMVAINQGTLEFKAFDLEGRLFDYMKIEKLTKRDPLQK